MRQQFHVHIFTRIRYCYARKNGRYILVVEEPYNNPTSAGFQDQFSRMSFAPLKFLIFAISDESSQLWRFHWKFLKLTVSRICALRGPKSRFQRSHFLLFKGRFWREVGRKNSGKNSMRSSHPFNVQFRVLSITSKVSKSLFSNKKRCFWKILKKNFRSSSL